MSFREPSEFGILPNEAASLGPLIGGYRPGRTGREAKETILQGLEIHVDESDAGIPVVHLKGEIDLHTCPELRTTLQALMAEGKYRVVLDLAEVPYLDSAALGVLVDAVRRARENGGGIFLVQVTPFVQRAFEITRLIKIFQVHPTLDDALHAANSGAGATGEQASAA